MNANANAPKFNAGLQVAANNRIINQLCPPVKLIDLRADQNGEGGLVKKIEEDTQKFYPKYETPNSLNFDFAEIFSKAVIVQTEEGRPKIVGWHGSNYKLIDNRDMIMPVVNELNKVFGKGGYKVDGYLNDHRQMVCNFVVNNETIGLPSVSEKDAITLKFTVENSFDGRIKPSNSAQLGFYRLVCTNGLMAFVIESEHSDRKKKHVESFNFDLSGIESQIELARKKVDHFKTLQERTLTTKELEEFFKDIEEQKLIQVRSIPTVQETLKNEMELLGQGANTWLLYNSINGMINHYMPNETYLPETKSALDTKVLSFITDRFDVALN